MPIVFDIASIHSYNQDSGILCYANNNYLHSPVLHNDEAVQPLQQNYRFMAFHAPIIQFQLPTDLHKDTTEFAPPQVYSTVDYMQPMPGEFNWNGTFGLQQAGQVNALRFITKNILSISTENNSVIEWQNHYLILPLAEPIKAEAGAVLRVSFNYRAGGSITHLQKSITASLEHKAILPDFTS